MALSNSQYNAIMRDYERRQIDNRHSQEQRVEEIYQRIPAVREIDHTVGLKAVERARQLLGGDIAARERLKREIAELGEQRTALLTAYGYPENYLEMSYTCGDCKDTGYIEGKKCHCFKRAQMKLLYAQSNIDQIVKKENFSTFSYDCFDDRQVIPEVGMTAAQYMKGVAEQCFRFARELGKKGGNILFTGSTGVGKTFLTNCIAKEAMDSYYSVLYLSANDLFEVFSKNRFESRSEEEIRDTYQSILECDLLIIDDLGTEINNSFTSSQLFYCINDRLASSRSTIISTNLSVNMLRDNYTDRVTSRIISGYRIIPLYGEDLRRRKLLGG